MELRKRDIIFMAMLYGLWKTREFVMELFEDNKKDIMDIEVEYEEVKPNSPALQRKIDNGQFKGLQ
jgi:hypothetical protein